MGESAGMDRGVRVVTGPLVMTDTAYIRLSDLSKVKIAGPLPSYGLASLDYRERIALAKRLIEPLWKEAAERGHWTVRNGCEVVQRELGELEVACGIELEIETS